MGGVDPWADTRAKLTAEWDVRGIDMATFVQDAMKATHRQPIVSPSTTSRLPPLLAQRGDVPPSFSLGRTLGQGGMGVVRAATQQALDREVAIKCLHEGADAASAAQLLREARVVGALEHPNIVPVHALGADANARPILVMKRIDGTGWDEALAGAGRDVDSEAYLRKHLSILQQVVRAAHFAHERGIVHRDIKPANVMLGSHDEVYLVDWGVAVGLPDNTIRGVPLASEVAAIEGTPAYMAPEMAAGDGEHIGVRTDVYLLGATLYEVLTGEPPHRGDTVIDVLTQAFASEAKPYPEGVPEHLRAICDKAMARFPEDRFASAQGFGDAIGVVLEHRASALLTEKANARLEELAAASHRVIDSDPAALHEAHTLYAECRFAFSHALATWPDNDAARRGLTRTVELMVDVELARDAPEAASLLLRDLPSPVQELQDAVNRAMKRRKQKGARLERLVRDANVRVGGPQRALIALLLGACWTTAFAGLGALNRYGLLVARHLHFLVIVAVGLVVASAAVYLVRHALVNRSSREQAISVLLLQVAHLIAVGTCWALALPLYATSAMMAIVGGVAFTTGTALIDRVYYPMVISTIAGLVLMLLWPSAHLEILGLGGGVGAVLIARNLLARSRDDARPSHAPSRP